MAGFRTHEGQHSDRMPIKRSAEQKRALLRQLKEQQAGLKPWVAESVKSSLARRIAELERDLAADAAPRRR